MGKLAKAGELEAMEQVLSKMRQQGVQPNVVTFNTMLNRYTSHNQPEQMEETMALMQSMGIEMDAVSYNTLMKGWIHVGCTEKVKEVLNQMHNSTHTHLTVEAWNIYADALDKAGELEAIEYEVSKMKQQGMQPNMFIVNAMLNQYSSYNQWRQQHSCKAPAPAST